MKHWNFSETTAYKRKELHIASSFLAILNVNTFKCILTSRKYFMSILLTIVFINSQFNLGKNFKEGAQLHSKMDKMIRVRFSSKTVSAVMTVRVNIDILIISLCLKFKFY